MEIKLAAAWVLQKKLYFTLPFLSLLWLAFISFMVALSLRSVYAKDLRDEMEGKLHLSSTQVD